MNRVPFRKERMEANHRDMGLASANNGKLAWSGKAFGYLCGWPYPAKHTIIVVWNNIACLIFGHSHLCRRRPGELPVCCDCCRSVKPTPEQEKSVINEW